MRQLGSTRKTFGRLERGRRWVPRAALLPFTSALAAACIVEGDGTHDEPDDPVDSGLTPRRTRDAGRVDAGTADAGPDTTVFVLRIANVSDRGPLSTGIANGTLVVHSGTNPLFEPGASARGGWLEALAEDGDPAAFGTLGGASPFNAAVPPSGLVEIPFGATPQAGLLSFAARVDETNDVFLAAAAVPLFDGFGRPLPARDLTGTVALWDSGTEADDAPGAGRDQRPRQPQPGAGSPEGAVRPFSASTRALPLARALIDVAVEDLAGESGYRFALRNVSRERGALVTSLSRAAWILHDASWHLFVPGSAAEAGLVSLAEKGDAAALAEWHRGGIGVGAVGSTSGDFAPGETVTFVVRPTLDHRRLSFAAAIEEANDAFIAPREDGVSLLDGRGVPRAAEEIRADLARLLVVWDAGSELDEAPGLGRHQVRRQRLLHDARADRDGVVRPALDPSNDLAPEEASRIARLTIANGALAGEFQVVLENRSSTTAFPSAFSPAFWALHGGGVALFTEGQPASAELGRLAEDGDPSALKAAMGAGAITGVEDLPQGFELAGSSGHGALPPGRVFRWKVTASRLASYFNLASMILASNDAFIALGPLGVRLLDGSGRPRSDADIAADVQASLRIYDAGTEANQCGGGGRDQAVRQLAPGDGAAEGTGLVRRLDDPVWSHPLVSEIARITIEPRR